MDWILSTYAILYYINIDFDALIKTLMDKIIWVDLNLTQIL
jgi:hypothetical protein